MGLGSFLKKAFRLGDNGRSNLEGFKIPEFQEDKDYRETQNYLKELGIDILGGDIPDYYKGIGESGGKEFEDYLSLMKGDVQSGVESAGAATGRTGGVVASQVAEKTGKLSTEARFKDYMRALEGKGFLFQQGRGITEGVRGAGQNQQLQKNTFNLDAAGLDLKKRLGLDEQDAAGGAAMGRLLEMGLGATAGYLTGGPVGAVVGASGGFDFTELLKDERDSKREGTKKDEEIGIGNIKVGKYKSLKGSVE